MKIYVCYIMVLLIVCVALAQEAKIYPIHDIPSLSVQPDIVADRTMEFTSVASMAFAIQGDDPNIWYDPRQLDGKVRVYVVAQKIPFNFTNVSAQIWINAGTNPILARIDYSSGIGRPALIVEVDRKGEIIRHCLATAVCGGGRGTRK